MAGEPDGFLTGLGHLGQRGNPVRWPVGFARKEFFDKCSGPLILASNSPYCA
jgi:hypothetical protein